MTTVLHKCTKLPWNYVHFFPEIRMCEVNYIGNFIMGCLYSQYGIILAITYITINHYKDKKEAL